MLPAILEPAKNGSRRTWLVTVMFTENGLLLGEGCRHMHQTQDLALTGRCVDVGEDCAWGVSRNICVKA